MISAKSLGFVLLVAILAFLVGVRVGQNWVFLKEFRYPVRAFKGEIARRSGNPFCVYWNMRSEDNTTFVTIARAGLFCRENSQ